MLGVESTLESIGYPTGLLPQEQDYPPNTTKLDIIGDIPRIR
jgi:hypothetical protein